MTNNPTANGPCRYHGNNTARETDSGAKSAGAGIIAARLSDLERNSATRRQRAGADSPPKAAGDRPALLAQQKVEKEAAKYHCRSHVDADRQWIMTHLRNGMKPREIEGLTRRSSAFIYSCKKLLAGEYPREATIAGQLSGYCSVYRRVQTGVQVPPKHQS